jgi:hypothetical protein
VTDESVIRRFQDVGLSLYEARIYVGLLRHGAQNGNELSKTSGVPSSKVYSTVEKMIGQGIVHSIKDGSSTQFVCIEPDELISRLRKQYNDPIDYLEQALPPLATFEPAEPFLNVTGQEEIHLSLWSADITSLRGSLESAVNRGVTIFGMLYSHDDELPPGTWLRHSYEEIVENRIGGRMLTLVSDAREALIARIPRRGDPSAVRTRSPVLTLIVQEYLHHDLVLQRAQISIGFDEWDRWWQADPNLRTVILGSTLQRGRDDVVALG